MSKMPRRGEIWAFESSPVLVVSPESFNQATGFAWTMKIGESAGNALELVLPESASTPGAVLVHQLSVVDLQVTPGRYVGSVPNNIIQDALVRARAILAGE